MAEKADSKIIDVVREGIYVIIQKQNYTKIHKVGKNIVTLGKDEVDIGPIIGEPFWTTYKMEPKENSRRSYSLKKTKCSVSISDEIIKDVSSGVDNREIIDDGSSQKLSTKEIVNLREAGMSAQDIVFQLIENSKTFLNKTEYSQEKYLKKKEKKYYEYIIIRQPSFRLIADVLLRNPAKVLGLRMDTLAQLTNIVGVKSGGTYILYETGCSGLVSAAFIDKLSNEGTIIHVYASNSDYPTQAVLALNLPKSQLNQLCGVNIQKLCRICKNDDLIKGDNKPIENNMLESSNSSQEALLGKRKLKTVSIVGGKMRRRDEDSERALEILKSQKADALVIVGKEHPNSIFKKLVKYLEISRPFVIYCPFREPLQELYCELKQRSDIIALRLTESWLRNFQVLPDRTHPNVRINGNGGFILSGFYVCS